MTTAAAAASAITVAILAGGRAERLGGVDKGLQPLGDRRLVEWVIDAISAQGPAGLLIVANRHLDQYAQLAPTISDALPEFRGPLAGVSSALAACPTEWLVSVPVDCACPPPDLLARFAAAVSDRAVHLLVAHDGERRQPLFAIYRRDLASSAAAAAQAGQGVWRWQDAMAARELDFRAQSAHFLNLNTPADFAAFVECNGG